MKDWKVLFNGRWSHTTVTGQMHCLLEAWQNESEGIILFTELSDNEGMSVRDVIEDLIVEAEIGLRFEGRNVKAFEGEDGKDKIERVQLNLIGVPHWREATPDEYRQIALLKGMAWG